MKHMFGLFKKKEEAKKETSPEKMSQDDCCGSGCCSDGGDCGCEHEAQEMKGSCGSNDCGCAHEASAEKPKKQGGCGCC
ncbi:MAG: hypothetical protein Q8R53_04355 [Nanoarchaeota archaeon]|nr:hypothetical protein [Nanoarchaeota archaeon]